MIGVLGGIGPEATGLFYARLIRELQSSGAIRRNTDFPRIVVNSIPAPELVSHPVTEEELAPYIRGLRQLDREAPDFIVMVCNTIHLYLERFEKEIGSPILSLQEAVREHLNGTARVGVLGTRATVEGGLYEFDGLDVRYPDVGRLMDAVVAYNRGEEQERNRAVVRAAARSLLDEGAERVILGCTEFAAMLGDEPGCIDTISVLAKAAARRARPGR